MVRLHDILITQPKLPSIPFRIPDFMWISTHSTAWFPTLIEIEKPDKRVFKQNGDPTADFSHAGTQLAQWHSWFSEPTNVLQFIEYYGIPDIMRNRTMRLRMILIYGRRSEFKENRQLTKLRGSLLPEHSELMSFDRLSAATSMADAITVKAKDSGKYQAVWIPPVFETGPELGGQASPY